MVGGNVGGIRLQIEDGRSGYLVNSAAEAGERIARLLAEPDLRAEIGRNAKERVRQRFLMPRLLRDYLEGGAVRPAPGPFPQRNALIYPLPERNTAAFRIWARAGRCRHKAHCAAIMTGRQRGREGRQDVRPPTPMPKPSRPQPSRRPPAGSNRGTAKMPRATILVMIDGLDPEYLDACPAPNLRRFAEQGFRAHGGGMMPSVTNVNNASMVTGHYPAQHGIVSNYWRDRQAGIEQYVESGEFICSDTIFAQCRRQGGRSLLAASKDKLRRLLGDDVHLAFSAEQPTPAGRCRRRRTAAHLLAGSQWLDDRRRPRRLAAGALRPGVYRHHRLRHAYLRAATSRIGAPYRHSGRRPGAAGGRPARCADSDYRRPRYVGQTPYAASAGHPGGAGHWRPGRFPSSKTAMWRIITTWGGCIYVHLDDPAAVDDALGALRAADGVEEAMPRGEAAARMSLMGARLGDILVTGAADVVFGDPTEVTLPPGLRSHGSRHETQVPIIGYGGDFGGFAFRETATWDAMSASGCSPRARRPFTSVSCLPQPLR